MATYTLPRTAAPEQAGAPAQRATSDRDAFARMYALTVDRVTRYVAVRLRHTDRDSIEDVVQDAFCHALASPELLQADPVGSMLRLAAWACSRHQWSNRRYVRAALTVGAHERAASLPPGPVTAQRPPGRITFAHALADLSDDQRRAIQLRHLDGLPRDAAAQEMNRTVVAFSSLEKRALRKLRNRLAPSATPAAVAP